MSSGLPMFNRTSRFSMNMDKRDSLEPHFSSNDRIVAYISLDNDRPYYCYLLHRYNLMLHVLYH